MGIVKFHLGPLRVVAHRNYLFTRAARVISERSITVLLGSINFNCYVFPDSVTLHSRLIHFCIGVTLGIPRVSGLNHGRYLTLSAHLHVMYLLA